MPVGTLTICTLLYIMYSLCPLSIRASSFFILAMIVVRADTLRTTKMLVLVICARLSRLFLHFWQSMNLSASTIQS